jgi:hypothetical protein
MAKAPFRTYVALLQHLRRECHDYYYDVVVDRSNAVNIFTATGGKLLSFFGYVYLPQLQMDEVEKMVDFIKTGKGACRIDGIDIQEEYDEEDDD